MTMPRHVENVHDELTTAANELEQILDRIDARGFQRLDSTDAERLPELIRNAATALATARSSGMNGPFVEYFESLLHQAWLTLRDAKRGYFRGQIALWLQTLPSILWGARWLLLFGALLFLCGGYIGFEWVQGDPHAAGRLFPAALADELALLADPSYAVHVLTTSYEHPLLVIMSVHGRLLWFFGGYAAIALLSVYFGAALTPFLLIGAGASFGAYLSVFPTEVRGDALLQALPYVLMFLVSMCLALAAGVRVVGSVLSHRQATRRADIAHRLQDGMALFYLALAHTLLSLPLFWLSVVVVSNSGGRVLILLGWLVLAAFYVGILGGLPRLMFEPLRRGPRSTP